MIGADPLSDASALRERIAAGATSAEAAVREALGRIDSLDAAVHAFSEVDRDGALARARELDRAQRGAATLGPLHGVPFALKSNMCWEGHEAHCGSKILAGWRAPYTATFVQRLIDAGAIPLGTTHMDEFAMGSSGENSAFAVARNPWDLARTPGGSSSGSAAAVTAGMVAFALGSDTGGSVRQPAALCGISGFKPTYGRVSRYGLVAFGSSLDQVSPFARSVRDLELLMGVLSGRDEHDATCADLAPIAPGTGRGRALAGLRVGVPREYFPESLDRGVRTRVEEAIGALERLGARVQPISLPHSPHAIATYYVVATAEASSNLARYDGVRYGLRVAGDGTLASMMASTRRAGFGSEVKRRILLGTYVLSSGYYDAWYGRALKVRGLLLADFETAFRSVDVIVGPTSPTAAFKLGEKADDPLAMYLSDVLTAAINLVGLPALSVPCGFTEVDGSRLPIGLQIIGQRMADAEVLEVGRIFQESTPHHMAVPPLERGAA